ASAHVRMRACGRRVSRARAPEPGRGATMRSRPRIVVLGGGFAGLGAVAKLGRADARVVLLDRHNYHTFQPMLYQLATALIAAEGVGHPLRAVQRAQRNLALHTAPATGIDLAAGQVHVPALGALPYD